VGGIPEFDDFHGHVHPLLVLVDRGEGDIAGALAGELEIVVFEAEYVAIVADCGAAGLVERNLVLVRHMVETARDLLFAGKVAINVVWELFEDAGCSLREVCVGDVCGRIC
jgi:hypothetical protein